MNDNDTPKDKDQQLWRIARRRAAFRRSLYTYLAVMAFLWLIWYFTGGNIHRNWVPWPVWPTIGWGIGIAMQWYSAFGPGSSHGDPAETEYEKLLRDRERR